jgi:hypothetical protein
MLMRFSIVEHLGIVVCSAARFSPLKEPFPHFILSALEIEQELHIDEILHHFLPRL